jgi:hypothetical protein
MKDWLCLEQMLDFVKVLEKKKIWAVLEGKHFIGLLEISSTDVKNMVMHASRQGI